MPWRITSRIACRSGELADPATVGVLHPATSKTAAMIRLDRSIADFNACKEAWLRRFEPAFFELRKVASYSPPGADARIGTLVIAILLVARGIIDAVTMCADEFKDATRELKS